MSALGYGSHHFPLLVERGFGGGDVTVDATMRDKLGGSPRSVLG